MENRNVWVIAGTSDGRMLINELVKMGMNVNVSVATDYGAGFLQPLCDYKISVGRMDYTQMCEFIQSLKPLVVVDATHPYAQVVTANIMKACETTKTTLLRLYRQKITPVAGVVYKNTMEEVVEFLKHTDGNILLTTGSKDLQSFCSIKDYQERIFVRILPMQESLSKALELGYKPSHIICMQGPFSVQMNVAMLDDYKIKYLISKDSGKVGGLDEKVLAADKCNAQLVIAGRPTETIEGNDIGEIIKTIRSMM